jgi:hypothetical protein
MEGGKLTPRIGNFAGVDADFVGLDELEEEL